MRRPSPRTANLLLALGATLLALGTLELALRILNLAPPTYNYGDAEVGWRAVGTGAMRTDSCWDLVSEKTVTFLRNEDGARSRYSAVTLRGDSLTRIGVSGDSHTDLCAPDSLVHFGIMERELRAAGVPTGTFSTGAGKYSPLQAYLATRTMLSATNADVFVLNLYTGNDFLDLLRVDDRPFLVAEGGSYRIADPVWYSYDPPGFIRKSRVLGLVEGFASKLGVSRIAVRIKYLRDVARLQGEGMGSVISYMNDLRLAASPTTSYPQAFSAQMLNQRLFFDRFKGSREESLQRLKFVLELVKKEQPNRLLVLSPVPSFQLVYPDSPNAEFDAVLARLSISRQAGVEQEARLYEEARRIAQEAGWEFVDNLSSLRNLESKEPLYNAADYHIEPIASQVIGRNQASLIREKIQLPRR